MKKNVCVLILSAVCAGEMALAATTSATVAAPEQGSTTATIEAVKPAAKRWSVSALQETMIDGNYAEARDAYADGYVQIGYKLNDTQKIALRPNFHMNQTEAVNNGHYGMGDTAIVFTDKAAFALNGTNVASDLRLYLPTNENSIENGKYEGRAGLAIDLPIAEKLSVTLADTVRMYTFTENDNGLNAARNYVAATFSYQATAAIAPYLEIGEIARWYHTGAGNGSLDKDNADTNPLNNRDEAYMDLGVNFTMGPVGLTVYAEQARNLRATNEFKLGRSEEMMYSAILSASL